MTASDSTFTAASGAESSINLAASASTSDAPSALPQNDDLDLDPDSDDSDALLAALESTHSDPALDQIQSQRLLQLKAELASAAPLTGIGTGTVAGGSRSGTYSELGRGEDGRGGSGERELMDTVTREKRCVVHFYKDGFARCSIMDGHLEQLAPLHPSTLFIRISVTNAPFLVTKLGIRVLPCVISFVDGVSVDRIVGFEGVGAGNDSVRTAEVESRLRRSGVLGGGAGASAAARKTKRDDDDASGSGSGAESEEEEKRHGRRGIRSANESVRRRSRFGGAAGQDHDDDDDWD